MEHDSGDNPRTHRWAELRPILIGAAFVVALVLGTVGYGDAESDLDLATALFRSVQLFVLEGGVVDGSTPWSLEVARYLAPAVVATPRSGGSWCSHVIRSSCGRPSCSRAGWFAANVPALDESGLRALRAELYKRSWNDDEIAARALVHTDAPRAASRESPPESPPAAFPEGNDVFECLWDMTKALSAATDRNVHGA